jgi:hypothetical protein
VSRLLLCLSFLCLCACKTTRSKDDTVILVEPNDPPPGAQGSPSGSAAAPDRPSAFSETLPPIRGGARVLPAYRGPDPCKMALMGDSPVAKACSASGVRGAMALMQIFVKRAAAEGLKFECVTCHADEDDYMNLRPDADAEFRKLLFLARPED